MVENFFDRNLIIDNRAALNRSGQRARQLYPQSIVRFLAHQLIDAGSTQMHIDADDLYGKFGTERAQTLLDPTASAEYNTYRSLAARDYSGIVVGSALIELEDTLVNGNFSKREFIERIRAAITNTPWIPPEVSIDSNKQDSKNEPTHDLAVGVSTLERTSSDISKPTTSQSGFSRDKIKRMRQEAGKDRTLASLLRNPGFRPRDLTDFLDEYRTILHPNFWQIVNRYEELAYEMIYGKKMAWEKRRDLR